MTRTNKGGTGLRCEITGKSHNTKKWCGRWLLRFFLEGRAFHGPFMIASGLLHPFRNSIGRQEKTECLKIIDRFRWEA